MAIIKCPECGHQINEKEVVCPVCGVEIAGHVARCKVCGEVYFTDEALCPNCHSAQYTVLGIDMPDTVITPERTGKDEFAFDPEYEDTSDTADEALPPPSNDIPSKKYTKPDTSVRKKENSSSKISEEQKTETNPKGKTEKSRITPVVDNRQIDLDFPEDDESTDEDTPKSEYEKEGTKSGSSFKRNLISLIVSVVVTLTVAAISMYYYQETKIAKEENDFERAIANNDTTLMKVFLTTYSNATKAHRDTINQRIALIRQNEKAFSESYAKKDKQGLLKYLKEHPSTKERKKILLLVDSLDWDSTVRINSRQAYQDYLTAHADGKFAEEAKDKLKDKVLEPTQADRDKMVTLFHNFFVGVNENEESQITSNLDSKITQFMGTENATHSQVVAWMKGQHKEGVKSVIWRMNRDYKITKREVNGVVQYLVDFTAQRDIVQESGKTSKEHFRITTGVTADGKISSMDMSTYTPSSNEKPAQPAATQQKPATTQQKPAATQQKPATTQQKPANTQQKPAAAQQKPAATQQKPAATQQKPATTQQKPASTQQKPANNAKK